MIYLKDYYFELLNEFINIYERRKLYVSSEGKIRPLTIDLIKKYKEYGDRFDHDSYHLINLSIDKLIKCGYIKADKLNDGKYKKIKFNIISIENAYDEVGKQSIPKKCDILKEILNSYIHSDSDIIYNFCKNQMNTLKSFEKLPYQIGYDKEKLYNALLILDAISNLKNETYVRNFSTAIFSDSKVFQKQYRGITESILFDYSDIIVEKIRILETYNLFDNPTYVSIKGDASIVLKTSTINTKDLTGGISLPATSLDDLINIEVNHSRVITVENLTTFHDTSEDSGVVIYLGGFHNEVKTELLQKIYNNNDDKEYYHSGDIDPYGFVILDNLIEKTGINFNPMDMGLQSLKKYHIAGLYKPLTDEDRSVILTNRAKHRDVFEYMLRNDCKVEQESKMAYKLLNISDL